MLEFDRIVNDAVVDLFRAFGLTVRPHHGSVEALENTDKTASTAAMLSLSGSEIRGTVSVEALFDLLASCCPHDRSRPKLSSSCATDWNIVRDVAKELVNQLVGRIKNRLSARGVTFDSRMPTAVSGNAVTGMLRGHTAMRYVFTADTQYVNVFVDVTLTPAGQQKISKSNINPPIREGEIIDL
jgi:CheY-specific phosphatase CheX